MEVSLLCAEGVAYGRGRVTQLFAYAFIFGGAGGSCRTVCSVLTWRRRVAWTIASFSACAAVPLWPWHCRQGSAAHFIARRACAIMLLMLNISLLRLHRRLSLSSLPPRKKKLLPGVACKPCYLLAANIKVAGLATFIRYNRHRGILRWRVTSLRKHLSCFLCLPPLCPLIVRLGMGIARIQLRSQRRDVLYRAANKARADGLWQEAGGRWRASAAASTLEMSVQRAV